MVAFVHNPTRPVRQRDHVTPKTVRPRRQLYISGQRYCSPTLGRWISRDPIGELGGYNVYGFAQNDPLSAIDLVGLMMSRVQVRRNTDPKECNTHYRPQLADKYRIFTKARNRRARLFWGAAWRQISFETQEFYSDIEVWGQTAFGLAHDQLSFFVVFAVSPKGTFLGGSKEMGHLSLALSAMGVKGAARESLSTLLASSSFKKMNPRDPCYGAVSEYMTILRVAVATHSLLEWWETWDEQTSSHCPCLYEEEKGKIGSWIHYWWGNKETMRAELDRMKLVVERGCGIVLPKDEDPMELSPLARIKDL